MFTKSRSLLLAAALMAAPVAGAMAQSPKAAPPTTPQMNSDTPAQNPNVPGATGQTVVKGSGSSMAASGRVEPNPNAASTTAGSTGGGH